MQLMAKEETIKSKTRVGTCNVYNLCIKEILFNVDES